MKHRIMKLMFMVVLASLLVWTPLLDLNGGVLANPENQGNEQAVTGSSQRVLENSVENEALVIVQDEVAQAVVVVAEDAEEEIIQVAETLVSYVEKATGATLSIISEADAGDSSNEDFVHLYVGHSAPDQAEAISTKLAGLDEEGFIIYPDENESITIIGPSKWGTRNGVYEFLERYVDVRWLMPGPTGEDVPTATDIYVLQEIVKEEPAFKYRAISARIGSTGWLDDNKLSAGPNSIDFMHNLDKVFPPDKYGESHPELYPGGNVPAQGNPTAWQPCFSEPASVDIAVDEIISYFDDNPEKKSFSLGINDSIIFCETTDEINSIGLPHMSEVYYNWVNDVVEKVLKVYPDKWFGLLAYYNVMDPPSFPLHERVIPFLTQDRMMWIDEDIRNASHQQMQEWNEVASQVAWYDYMYGTLYLLPRVYPRLMAEIYQYAAENDVYGHYTEMYHNIGDGPKAWISAKLKWNPNQDVESLLQEWYERAVGSEAADDLAAYYDLWEDFWTERIKEGEWFYSGNGTYLNFFSSGYMDLVTLEDIMKSKQLLESVVAKAQTEPQKKRADLIYRMFEYYEATVLSYPQKSDPPESETAALEIFNRLLDSADRAEMAQKRHELIEELNEDPASRFQILPRVNWPRWNAEDFWNLVDYIESSEDQGGTVMDQIYELANEDAPSDHREFARLMQEVMKGSNHSITANSSFELGNEDAASWSEWIVSTGAIKRTEEKAYTGKASLLVERLNRGGPNQNQLTVKPGPAAARVHYYTPVGTDEGAIDLVLHAKNAKGENIMSFSSPVVKLSESAGEWTSLGLLAEIPESVDGEEVAYAQIIARIDGAMNTKVYLDDLDIYQGKENPLVWTAEEFWETVDYMAEHESDGGPRTDEIQEMANTSDSSKERGMARLVLEATKGLEVSLIANPSFEVGNKNAPSWQYYAPYGGDIERVEDNALTGEASLFIENLNRGGLIQNVSPVQPGPTALRVDYYTPPGTEQGAIQIVLHAKNNQRDNLLSWTSPETLFANSDGQWSSLGMLADIPEAVDGEDIASYQVVVLLSGAIDAKVHIDNVVLYQASEMPVEVDKTELGDTLEEAEQLYEASEEGTEPGQYPLGAKAMLQAAIETAAEVYEAADATEEEIEEAVLTLREAMLTFQGKKNSLIWTAEQFWETVDYMAEHESDGGPRTDEIQEMANTSDSSKEREMARLVLEAIKGLEVSLIANPSFEVGNKIAPPWQYYAPYGGDIERVEDNAHTGEASLFIENLNRGGLIQNHIPVKPGSIALRVNYHTPSDTEQGAIQIILYAKNDQGQNLLSWTSPEKLFSNSDGQWSSLGMLADIPEAVDGEDVAYYQVVVLLSGAIDAKVHIDNVVLYQASEMPVEVDKTELGDTLEEAEQLHEASEEGTDPGEYPVGSKAMLQAAIETAAEVFEAAYATEEEVAGAVLTLREAISMFLAAVHPDMQAPTWQEKNLQPVEITESEVLLQWSGVYDVESVTGFKIYRDGGEVATVTGDVYTYRALGLSADTSYHFQVEAGNAAGEWSTDGPRVTVKTLKEADSGGGEDLAAPTWPGFPLVAASDVEKRSLVLTWTLAEDDTGVTAYRVVWEDGSREVSGDSNRLELTGLSADTTYTFKVEAGDEAGNWSTDGPSITVRTLPTSGGRSGIYIPWQPPVTPEEPSEAVEPEESSELTEPEVPTEPEEPTVHLSDIEGHWAMDEIERAVEKKLVAGYPDETFKPNASVTRAEFIMMLSNALQWEEEAIPTSFLDETEIGDWARAAIAGGVQRDVIQGYEDGRFRPNQAITRTEMAVMLARALEWSLEAERSGFADAEEIPHWGKPAVEALREQGIVSGRGENRFVPQGIATRAEAIVILLRALDN